MLSATRPALFAALLLAAPAGSGAALEFGEVKVTLAGAPAPPASSSLYGFSVLGAGAGPQAALIERPAALIIALRGGEEFSVTVPVRGLSGPFALSARVRIAPAGRPEGDGGDGEAREVEIGLAAGPAAAREVARAGDDRQLRVEGAEPPGGAARLRLETAALSGSWRVEWRSVRLQTSAGSCEVPLAPPAGGDRLPPPLFPRLRRPIEEALIEWDWRLQDGIGTDRAPATFREALERLLTSGGALLRDLEEAGALSTRDRARWEALRREWEALAAGSGSDESAWEALWLRAHRGRRRLALANPLARFGPLAFVKQVSGAFSHQLTQYYGRYARPGGGIFVLEAPGDSMDHRELTAGLLPAGSYQHLELSDAGDRLLFSYCRAEAPPADAIEGERGRYFHLYEIAAGGSGLRQLTDGPHDDFAPRFLPGGGIIFVSTRRLGWHRCGNPGCENYTLALAGADGSRPRPISYHETHEWDPAVLDDGRIIYTRWDYVDRHAVYYEQLWTVRPDGTAPSAFYGNNTFNPVGLWEARQVPGSSLVMATAAAHHAMTAGSIVLVDTARGLEGLRPLTRLTPEAPFPESEAAVLPHWRAPVAAEPPRPGPEADRWPGQCYRSPYPLGGKYFLVAYSFEPLVGEPQANRPNMFGLYLADGFGNKELLYRDLNISSLWPVPLRPRPPPPVLPGVCESGGGDKGLFLLLDVYRAQPALPPGTVKRLRIVQVLPKSTPGINRPPLGLANASPGKQVLGTVPVDPDGSAYFLAPARVPLSFQALDGLGRAVQIMRSATYLQPGETAACVGCHEPRAEAPPVRARPLAARRPPSRIEPGPDGSRPLSYPLLVQPVLDRECVSCHGEDEPAGGVRLTGEAEGHYTVSYNALAPRVRWSAWTGSGDFRRLNSEPVSTPGFFGARGSRLMAMLLDGHEGVKLSGDDRERLVTWMDANALFYGTFDPEAQARQRRGEAIAGPALE